MHRTNEIAPFTTKPSRDIGDAQIERVHAKAGDATRGMSTRHPRKKPSMHRGAPSNRATDAMCKDAARPNSVATVAPMRLSAASEPPSYECIRIEVRGPTGIITFNRPQVLNALNDKMRSEIDDALNHLENDPAIGAIVLTGGDKVFAAGADVKEMLGKTYPEIYKEDFITRGWDGVGKCRKPVIAAVAGYALGGGCEIAMMCDIIVAADNARFAQPEINLGTTPGEGGTQRLPRFIGKAKAMLMCLTGRMMDAAAAERAGLVSLVVPADQLLPETLKIAGEISEKSQPIAMMVKQSVNNAFETPLTAGLQAERNGFYSTFATEDRKEGMQAFLEHRKPKFKNR